MVSRVLDGVASIYLFASVADGNLAQYQRRKLGRRVNVQREYQSNSVTQKGNREEMGIPQILLLILPPQQLMIPGQLRPIKLSPEPLESPGLRLCLTRNR